MKRIALIFCLLGTSWLFGADNSDIIWTWGNSKLVASIFSWTYFVLGIDTIQDMVKYTALIGGSLLCLKEIAKGDAFDPQVVMVKVLFYMGITYGISIMFLEVRQDDTHRVYIVSANELADPIWAKCRPVNGDDNCYAPTGVKMIVSAITNFERASIQMMEKSMMDANAMTYSFSQMGLGFGFTFFDHIAKNVDDAYAYNTFMDYYENCILYDLSDGTKSVDDLYKSNDLATYILSPNSRLTNVYSKAKPQGELQTCYAVSSSALWGSINCNTTASEVKGKMSGTPAAETTTDDICLAAQNFGQLMFNTTKDATAQIEQQTIMNLTNESIVNSAIASGMDPTTLSYGTAMADREQTAKWTTMGVMAKEWIPTGRGIMQSVAIGLIWILALFAIATASPMEYIGAIVGYQATLMVWSVLLAILNYATISIAADQASTTFMSVLGSGDQMTLWSQPTHHEQFQKAQAFLGYMAILSYGIAVSLVGKAATKLGSIGNGISQLAVGMGTSANMAKGQFDHGFDKSDASGTQAVNHRDGSVDRYNPTGYREHQANQSGYGNNKETIQSDIGGGSLTSEEQTNPDGTKSAKISTSDGSQSVAMNKDHKVTDAKLSGIQSHVDQSLGHEIEKTKGQAATLEKSGSEHLTSSIQDTNTTAQQITKGVGMEHGTSAGSEFAHRYNENVQQNLQKAYESGQLSEDAYNKLRDVKYSAGFEVAATAKGGVEVFGNGITTSGTAKGSATATSTGQHGQKDSISLSEKDAVAFSQAMATGLDVTAKSSDSISANQKENISHNTASALTKTNQASHDFSQSAKLSETASKMEKDKNSTSASMSKDLNLEIAQKTIDQYGLTKGSDLLFNDKEYVTRSAQELIHNKFDQMQHVDTGSTFKKAESGIGQAQGIVHPVNTSNPQNVDLNGKYSGYQGDVTHQGSQWQNNMPSTDNAPTIPTDNNLEHKVKDSHLDHSNASVSQFANPTDSLFDSATQTGKELVKDANLKYSADGTYTDRNGVKHDWSNKGRTER